MSFSDRIRAWFKGEGKRRSPGPSSSPPSKISTKDLEEFLRTHNGVEGYMEPRTAIYSTTLLLVAGDGEYLRRPVRDRDQADELCTKHNVPLYDAAIVGYPQRMRDFDRGIKRDEITLDDLPPWPGDDGPDEPPAAAGDDSPTTS